VHPQHHHVLDLPAGDHVAHAAHEDRRGGRGSGPDPPQPPTSRARRWGKHDAFFRRGPGRRRPRRDRTRGAGKDAERRHRSEPRSSEAEARQHDSPEAAPGRTRGCIPLIIGIAPRPQRSTPLPSRLLISDPVDGASGVAGSVGATRRRRGRPRNGGPDAGHGYAIQASPFRKARMRPRRRRATRRRRRSDLPCELRRTGRRGTASLRR